jgi:hypothetical protein
MVPMDCYGIVRALCTFRIKVGIGAPQVSYDQPNVTITSMPRTRVSDGVNSLAVLVAVVADSPCVARYCIFFSPPEHILAKFPFIV